MRIDPSRYRQAFFDEAAEHLDALEAVLLRLEAGPHDPEAVDEGFRAAHSVKGSADAVGLPGVAQFTHRLEGLLDRFRGPGGPIPAPLLELLLRAADHLRLVVAAARDDRPAPPGVDDLLGELDRAAAGPAPDAPPPPAAEPPTYAVTVSPSPEAFRAGLDPVPLLRAVAGLGEVVRVDPDLGRLPPLAALDPERCYVGWTVYLRTDRPQAEIADVFAFAEDNVRATVDRVSAAPPPPRPVAPAPAPAPPPAAQAGDPAPPPADTPTARPVPAADEPTPTPPARAEAPPPKSSVSGARPSAGPDEPVPPGDPDERRCALFGTFLVRRGVLAAEQVLEALDRQQTTRPSIGRLAVDAGLMTVRQLFSTAKRSGPGQPFEEVAVRLGLLSEADLGRLLLAQCRAVRPLGELLAAAGHLTPDRLAAEVAAFRELTGHDAELEDPPSDVVGTPPARPAPSPAAAAADPDALRPPSAAQMTENAEMIAEFCGEADEHLEAADRHLLSLSENPTDKEALNATYRAYHSIKGVAGMLELRPVQALAHEAENLLNLARDGTLTLRGLALDIAFTSTDALKKQIGYVRQWLADRGELASDPALPEVLAALRKVAGNEIIAGPAGGPGPGAGSAPAPTPAAPPPPENAPPAPAAEKPADKPPPPRDADAADKPKAARPAGEKETVRVDRDRLDKLVNAIGELVIAQSMAEQEFGELAGLAGLRSRAMPELTKISRDLQELGLSLRMVPLAGTFQKMARLVRDLSRKMDKPVALELHGEETELDKTVVDQLGDPLMHMVRNAVDHGLEPAADRVAAGKAEAGRVSLRAYHRGGSVYIELADDGRGLDPERIFRKAVEKGIVPADARLTEAETFALIFEPGFSTAAAVTDVSGRGVGMDVVRRNVEALQGTVAIRSRKGHGTTFTIRLPLTLAIMDGLTVGIADEVYVLPILSVVDSFVPRPGDIRRVAGRGLVAMAHGEPVPLLPLDRLLGRPAQDPAAAGRLVVLVENEGQRFALVVDDLLGQMQAVVKSLDANFGRVEGLAGATILGDGRVAMILDIHGLTKLHTQYGGGYPLPADALQGATA